MDKPYYYTAKFGNIFHKVYCQRLKSISTTNL